MDQKIVNAVIRRMTEARARLLRENPFFGHLALGLRPACAPCETACTDGSRIIFDPDFAARLNDREMEFIVLHELMHCVLQHCTRGRSLDHLVYNIACDIVVNSTILQMWGLDDFEVAGEKAMHRVPDGREGRLFCAEEVYQMLLLSVAVQDAGFGNGGRSDGMKPEGDEGRGAGDHGGPEGSGLLPGTIDCHDLWQGIAQPAEMNDSWNTRIRQASQACGDTGGMPQSIRRIAEELVRSTGKDWRQILHDFIQHDRRDYVFTPPDRRYSESDFFLPAYEIDEDDGAANDIWVCVDTSGSISDEELAGARAEIADAMRQAGLNGKLSFFDSEITEPVLLTDACDLKSIEPVGGGGTSFDVIFRYMRDHMSHELPRAVLIFTDGYASVPDESAAMDVPVLWIISRGGCTDYLWGTVTEL